METPIKLDEKIFSEKGSKADNALAHLLIKHIRKQLIQRKEIPKVFLDSLYPLFRISSPN